MGTSRFNVLSGGSSVGLHSQYIRIMRGSWLLLAALASLVAAATALPRSAYQDYLNKVKANHPDNKRKHYSGSGPGARVLQSREYLNNMLENEGGRPEVTLEECKEWLARVQRLRGGRRKGRKGQR